MAETFEQSLRRAMVAFGNIVEHVIGKVRRAKVQVESRGGLQPLLSIESQLSSTRIKDIVNASIQRVMSNAFPSLKGTHALEIGEAPAQYGSRLLGAQAAVAIGVEIGGPFTEKQGDVSTGFVIRSQPGRLPLPGGRFSYFIARLSTPFQGDVSRSIQELGRVLVPGGQGVFIDYHPFGLFAKRGANKLRPSESSQLKFEDYYRIFRNAGLRVVDLREAFIGEELRSMFGEKEISAYRAVKGTPLLAFFFVYKPKAQ